MLSKKDLVAINKEFHAGRMLNESSLDYAIAYARKTKDWLKAAAYLVRAILIDHAFEDGNKRTAAAVIENYIDINGHYFNQDRVNRVVLQIMRKNITDTRKIARLIQNATE